MDDETYDIIVCLDTLEHTLYPKKIMEEIMRVAKKDAILFLSMPNEFNLYTRLKNFFGMKTPAQETFQTIDKHLHIHSPRVKDILDFFGGFGNFWKIKYGWHSRSVLTDTGVLGFIVYPVDLIFKMLSGIYPNLFCRTVAVMGNKKLRRDLG